MTNSFQTKMAEMRLDLCIQSTNHLMETVSNIKENIRILEVFLNSGLKSIDFSGNTTGFTSGEYSTSEGRGSTGPDQRFYQRFSEFTPTGVSHSNCCCMCRFRQTGVERENLSISRTSAATASLSSNPSSLKKSRPAPPIPRLNRTASLRRETVLQRQRAQEICRKKSFL